jgi:hypothetical protein
MTVLGLRTLCQVVNIQKKTDIRAVELGSFLVRAMQVLKEECWFQLAQDVLHWRAFIIMVVNVWVI